MSYYHRLAKDLMDKYGTNSFHILRLGVRLHLEENSVCDGHGCGLSIVGNTRETGRK